MPVVTNEAVRGFVSCRDPRCAGYQDRPTDVIRQYQAFSYRELGGDLPGDERVAVDVVQGDAPCEVCGGPQVWYDQERPEYAPISGQDQLALLNLNQSGQIKDAQMAQLQQAKDLAEMRAQMAEMAAELQRRRGGRPVKDAE